MKIPCRHNTGYLEYLLLCISLVRGLLGGMPSPLRTETLAPMRRQAQSRAAVVVQGSRRLSDQYPLPSTVNLNKKNPILAS